MSKCFLDRCEIIRALEPESPNILSQVWDGVSDQINATLGFVFKKVSFGVEETCASDDHHWTL